VFKSAVLVVLCAAASFTHASSSRLDDIREVGEMTVAVYESFPPFSFREGNQRRGIDVDIAEEIAAKIGVKPVIRVVGADESVEDDLRNNVWKGHYLGGGVADVMLHVPFDREFQQRNDRVRLVGAYYREQIVIALSSEYKPQSDVLELFRREKVGVELDTLADFYLLTADDGRMRDNVVHFTRVADAVDALLARRLTGVMAPRSEIEGAAGNRINELVLVEPGRLPGMLRTGWDLGVAVKQGHDALAEAVQTAVGELHRAGRLAEIFTAYGVTYQPASQVRF
jgi:ABC-type amino acid transport substrate-binding protein